MALIRRCEPVHIIAPSRTRTSPRAAGTAPTGGRCADPGEKKVAEPVVKPGSVVDSHSSTASVTAGLQHPTRVRHEPCHSTPIWTCSGWGLPCPVALSPRAVGSYPTVSPLPRTLAGRSAVCFLLHFPSAHAAQGLPGTLLHGARTFLGALLRRDCLDRLRRGGFSHALAGVAGWGMKPWGRMSAGGCPKPHHRRTATCAARR